MAEQETHWERETPPKALRKLTDSWRSTTARLILIYGAFFALWGGVVVGCIYWQAAGYLDRVSDDLIGRQADYFSMLDELTRLRALNDYNTLETRRLNAWGLFNANGKYLSGTITMLPKKVHVVRCQPAATCAPQRNDTGRREEGGRGTGASGPPRCDCTMGA
ncbi:MAG: hypothetical protein WDW38_000226 [Sanguina aurantia]